ncbi:hypothetical protein QR680_019119 [Steinernema hermaphroditum]|uniref:Uncharacterized protein n=1 Tax=Steinernema hermaphroditum TaxID=289476 RepID=A0AA39HK04_9BILA|nr:hypothetical protein QR680_019119 [Steinernema hermaphroditum]
MPILACFTVIPVLLLPYVLNTCAGKTKSQKKPTEMPCDPQKAQKPLAALAGRMDITQSDKTLKSRKESVALKAKSCKSVKDKNEGSSEQKKTEKTDFDDRNKGKKTNESSDASKDRDDKKKQKVGKPPEKKSPPPVINEALVKKEYLQNSQRQKQMEKEIEEMGSDHEMDKVEIGEIDPNKKLTFKENECRMYYTNAKSVDWMKKVAAGIPVEKKNPKKKKPELKEEDEDENENNALI